MALTRDEIKRLRGEAHGLAPVVRIGDNGLTDGVHGAIDDALEAHELIKVRCGSECPQAPKEVGEALAERLRAAFVQKLGRTVLLYRRHPKKPKINLPASA